MTLLWVAAALLVTAPVVAQPHVLQITVDDMSLSLLDGARLSGTVPDIYSIAALGTMFPRAVTTNPICAPSRASMMTGRYSGRTGVHCNQPTCLNGATGAAAYLDHANTLPAWLTGYRKAHFGKWINHPSGGFAPLPEWDEWQGLVDPSTYLAYGWTLNVNGALVQGVQGEHQTRALAARAVSWISANKGAAPLYVHLAPVVPHFTWDYALAPFDGTQADGWKVVSFPDLLDYTLNPPAWNAAIGAAFIPGSKPSFGATLKVPELARSMTTTDRDRARTQYAFSQLSLIALNALVRDAVAAFGADPVVVIFVSDNGYNHGEHAFSAKMSPTDESIFVPLFIYGKGLGWPAQMRQEMVLLQDLPVTIAAIAGATPTAEVDGRSLLPLLRGESLPWRTAAMIEHWEGTWNVSYQADFPDYHAIRTAPTDPLPRRLYVEFLGGGCALFDMNVDPYQMTNLCASRPAEVATLAARLGALKACAGSTCIAAEN